MLKLILHLGICFQTHIDELVGIPDDDVSIHANLEGALFVWDSSEGGGLFTHQPDHVLQSHACLLCPSPEQRQS